MGRAIRSHPLDHVAPDIADAAAKAALDAEARRATRDRHLTLSTLTDGRLRLTGTLDTGLHLTPAAVRRLACDATILPAVLSGAGQPLDLGRQRRLITGPLRRALVLRDGGCACPHRADPNRDPLLARGSAG
ncbi:DUF222 domain-containing protein [Micromonospora trifolii]|uniref:DUF222 domain-containing protein n=1 Tax=Micromonospora trifolii TaxID=2911208 RepID=UPI003D2F2313